MSMLCVKLFPTLLQNLTVSSYRGMLKFENSHHNDFLYSLLQVCAVFGNLHLFVYVLLLGCSMSLLFHMENADLKNKDGVGSDC